MTFFGRKDRQIKVRGYRVELEEVADGMLELEGIEEAAAVGAPTKEGPLTVAAYAVKKTGHEVTEKEVIGHLSSKIPAYAVPTKIVWMEGLPRTSATKVDHRKLTELAKTLNDD